MRRHLRVGTALFAVFQGTDARGQEAGVDAHALWPAALDADPRNGLILQRPHAFSQGDFFVGILGEYAADPLVQVLAPEPGAPGEEFSALDNLVVLNASIGVALHERLRLDVAVPFVASSTRLDRPGAPAVANGTALGDTRIAAMFVPVRPPGVVGGGGFGLGVVGSLDLPTGDSALFLGTGAVSGGGELAVTGELGPGTLGATVGARQDAPVKGFPGADGGPRATFGASAGVLASDEVGLGLEIAGRPALVPAAIAGAGFPLELVANTRYRNPSGGFLVVGGAVGLTDAVGVPAFRLFVGGGYAREKPPRPVDFDPVGPVLSSDACPLEREVANGWRDDDGCPDQLGALLVDVRHQGVAVAATAQVVGPAGPRTEAVGVGGLAIDAVPGTQWSITASDGCLVGAGSALVSETATSLRIDLVPRFDARVIVDIAGPDGVPIGGATATWTSARPECVPAVPVFAASTGRIGQEVSSGLAHVLVVTAPGYTVVETPLELRPGEERALRIELRPTKIKLEANQIVIFEKVQFDTGRASIKPESFGLLDEVAATILAHPEIGRVEVAGHTDNQGSDAANLRLSQDRASAVLTYLSGKGVLASALVAKGYGETAPLDTNRTEVGRERNRRVEFILIDRAPAPGGTP